MIDTRFQELINRELQRFFDRKRKESQKLDKRFPELINQIADVTLRGGDRLRPYMCYLGYQVGGGTDPEAIMFALLALELFHSFALIHDDIMDEANLRRGGPTIHAYFTQILRKPHVAYSLALLAGDLCAEWGQELFDKITPSNPRTSLRGGEGELRSLFDQLRQEVILGQTSDIWGMQGATSDEIRQMYRYKSGNYSIQKPLLLGAGLAGVSASTMKQLAKYGEAVGLAFQLKDDWLGIFGDESTTGKAVGADIVEGKWTLLIAKAFQKLANIDRQRLKNLLLSHQVTREELRWVRERLVTSGAKTSLEDEMQNLVEAAKQAIVTLPKQVQKSLVQLAEFAITRRT
ncbi:MAG: Polyprenyl synthetase [Candidatus Gottesmanbacteria bacterium GW2011_GWB1_43_11]|uniref:Polyprenyl synthetase n=1 Tax=Candidatus Gottesmanbacteria bacterium GW2011_GWB1_43_11 TaxID=1618446 RepID=A0A0G1CLT6_9BACT|nr:MAG: Polyprenyl synthetase [Candidatus Gottesmanbacteria bacterium GW2011_GWA2_42_16]KKS53536.1 MAG: Polyprenyl synthetase [Candidatus Gottesmanbacteria bacterium GW2011_GWA1_42_26]KKS81210.1 MAG: Polyprenyl synthetase [Candidatus Gottesmanbacteria bacterium GW2011_GWC1_43_10]KKS86469.1 MAG: Polyprenyl synthetase [Candidatus Gottesmanbacteria bacterium GW2011_GWB1_43_11]OGG10114.1 MAG: hypothetical protein A2699_03685 [Candidatus Gottesmanbacteria bacterium RIFCSPHIGHO2_01_FULL_43_15]HCM374